MASNYEKRRTRTTEAVRAEIEAKRSEIREGKAPEPAPQYTNTGYDVYTMDGGRTYKVAEFSYNPATSQATVIDTFNISRVIALAYENKKTALGILKKKR